jgi:hypothetical protein
LGRREVGKLPVIILQFKKRKTNSNRKSTTCAICWLKSILHEEKRREQENHNVGRCTLSVSVFLFENFRLITSNPPASFPPKINKNWGVCGWQKIGLEMVKTAHQKRAVEAQNINKFMRVLIDANVFGQSCG